MYWRIFGGPAVRSNGVDVELTSTQARLLGILLVRANHTIELSTLCDHLWVGSPPEGAGVALRMHVARLRKRLLDGAGIVDVLATGHHGYRLNVEPLDIDVHRFEALVLQANVLERRHREAVEERLDVLERALAIADDEPLGEFASERWASGVAEHWSDRRLSVEDTRFELLIESGKVSMAADELAEATAAHPYREHRWALRMLALYRCGRQADALRLYHKARAALVEDLGIEPGDELRSLECAILRREPRLLVDAAPNGGNLPVYITSVRSPSRDGGAFWISPQPRPERLAERPPPVDLDA